MARIPTRSWIKGKRTVFIQVDRIRPTNPLIGSILKIKYSPILLIKANDGYFYIADGNHRFFKKLSAHGQSMEAWILEEGDQCRIFGDPLPQYVRVWKEGVIGLKKLADMAMEAYKEIRAEVKPVLEYWHSAKGDSRGLLKGGRGFEERDHDVLALSLFNSILKIIKETSTLEEQAHVNKMNETDFVRLYKCFVEGGMRALRKRVRIRGEDKQYPLFSGTGRMSDCRKQPRLFPSHSGH